MDSYQITFQNWDKVASIYQEYFMDLDLYDATYDAFCDLIKKRAPRVFEIGCGPGNITRYLLSKRPDFKIEAIDISPNMIGLAQANNPDADFKVMDCRKIDHLATTFDAIVCGFCMPYLSEKDSTKLIKDCAALLADGGLFYFSTIEGDYEQSGYETSSRGGDKMYVYYHSEAFLEGLLAANGFELTALQRKNYSKKDGTAQTHLIFIVRKRNKA